MTHAFRPTVLCILDGWGLRAETDANAVALARTPVYDRLMATRPHATLRTSGSDVGLPDGQMGNSEVGHMNIGAGRVVWMDLPRIDRAIEDGSFAENDALRAFADKVKAAGGTAHVLGLLSPGGVHSHQRHMAAAAQALAALGVPVLLHAFTDGRDVAPSSAPEHLAAFRRVAPEARFATVSGRFYAMDRDKRWERVQAAFDAMVRGRGETAATAEDAVAAAHARGETDEFVAPTVIGDYAGMRDGDGALCVNFRADRAREILAALGDPDFDGFDVSARPRLSAMCGFASYSGAHDRHMSVMFPPQDIANTLAEWVSAQGLAQFHVAETEKYPHVTFFLNGGIETPWPGETRHMAPSPKVRTYDMKPEMSAAEVRDHLVAAIDGGENALIVANFANPDMVGHTGDLAAAIAAVETVDAALGDVAAAVERAGGAMLVFADHGNCEMMVDPETGGPHTAHTTNPVPLILVGGPEGATLSDGRLADVAPTALALMGLRRPPEMTGRVLVGA
ncbi:MAG: 2,3-bisphosphoglycerate-independent phosphoglycerate mutase [Rubrimonas sp.]|uniref:2,3-bisphosphoglycerate-independent phosphoglycerate mutase n=1 Tax=Rubrimonas sp. TaxID=2036015 RepID=UPI002FDD5B25